MGMAIDGFLKSRLKQSPATGHASSEIEGFSLLASSSTRPTSHDYTSPPKIAYLYNREETSIEQVPSPLSDLLLWTLRLVPV